MKKYFLISLFFVFGFSCDKVTETDPKFVIEAFIFAGESVGNFKIKEQIGIKELAGNEVLISDAEVILVKDGLEYTLDYDGEVYNYSGNDLVVESGDLFGLEVTVGDRTATAETIVPESTKGLTISDTEVIVPTLILSFGLINQLRELFFNARLTAKWDNPNDELHFIAVEPVIAEGNPIFPEGFPDDATEFLSSFKFAPQALEVDTFSIIGIAFENYGRHRAKVYRVNQEYADLFNNPEQDSRDLTAPPSNVVNGFGIFSAFAADSVFFDIVRE